MTFAAAASGLLTVSAPSSTASLYTRMTNDLVVWLDHRIENSDAQQAAFGTADSQEVFTKE